LTAPLPFLLETEQGIVVGIQDYIGKLFLRLAFINYRAGDCVYLGNFLDDFHGQPVQPLRARLISPAKEKEVQSYFKRRGMREKMPIGNWWEAVAD